MKRSRPGSSPRGPDEIEAFVGDTYAAFSNVQVTPRTGFQAEEWAVMEADFSGESAEGTDFSIPFIVVFELDGDRIARNADYYDLSSLMAQLEPPAAEATPAA
jgi:limonene-1,2-epoxide hydrolase